MYLTFPPQKTLLVDLKLNNPSDPNTYYVRVVIVDAISGETLDTLELEDNGDKYFSKPWLSAPDITGQGRQLSVFKTVYEDPSYTVESSAYGTVHETWLLETPSNANLGYGGVDYKAIRDIVREAVADIPRDRPDLEPILGAIDESHGSVMDRIGEHISSSVDLGAKAESLSGMEQGVQKTMEKLMSATASLQSAITAISSMLQQSASGATRAAEAAQGLQDSIGRTIEGKFDEEMTRAIDVLRENVQIAATQLSEAVQSASKEMLKKPIKLSLAPEGKMRVQTSSDEGEAKPVRGLDRLINTK